MYFQSCLTTCGRESLGGVSRAASPWVGVETTYLALPTDVGQGVAEVEWLLEAAAGLPLRFPIGVGIVGVAVVVGAHPLRALLLGGLGLGFRLGFGHAGSARHAAAGQSVLLCLQLGRQAGVGILARALPLLLFAGGQRNLDRAVGAGVVVRGRAAVGVMLGGRARRGRRHLGHLGGRYGVESGFDQALDGSLRGVSMVAGSKACSRYGLSAR